MAKKKRNLGGRPSIPESERMEKHIFRIRSADYSKIEQAAAVQDEGNVSEVVRRGALKEADRLLRAARRRT